MNYIAFDSHKKYTQVSIERKDGGLIRESRIEHERGAIKRFLLNCEVGSPVAVETIGNWYWIVDEIEQAGMKPQLVHARRAKMMMASVNKTDKLDCRGLNRLQRTGTLPTVWIPTGQMRDRRELPRTRMALTAERVKLKNRIHATLAKYALIVNTSDAFGRKGLAIIGQLLAELPPDTRFGVQSMLNQLASLEQTIEQIEERMQTTFAKTNELELLMSMPGIGPILGAVIVAEVGDISRFPTPEKFASYAGTTPRVTSSGGHTYIGRLRPDVNRYLKWAFIEAANVICINRRRWPQRHVCRRYEQVAKTRNHQKAIGAVARHLAEAAFWILRRNEPYKEPHCVSSIGKVSA